MIAAALVGVTVAVILALDNDVIAAHCDGPTGGWRCDFKRLFAWRLGPPVADALVIGIGAAAGALVGLLVERSTGPTRSGHATSP